METGHYILFAASGSANIQPTNDNKLLTAMDRICHKRNELYSTAYFPIPAKRL
jgi:hypothetical protein